MEGEAAPPSPSPVSAGPTRALKVSLLSVPRNYSLCPRAFARLCHQHKVFPEPCCTSTIILTQPETSWCLSSMASQAFPSLVFCFSGKGVSEGDLRLHPKAELKS